MGVALSILRSGEGAVSDSGWRPARGRPQTNTPDNREPLMHSEGLGARL